MPKVNENGTEIIFKIFPHYREDILTGRKKVDFRCLNDKWFNMCKFAERVRYICEGKPDVLIKLDSVDTLGGFRPLLAKIYADICFGTDPIYVLYFDCLGKVWEDKDGD